ncbi:MAG: hypothetical protein ABR541_08105 [Candidatus Dormibacteria bacterium]
MADDVQAARAEIERERVALNSTLDRLEAKVHRELDWKTKVRRQAPKLIAIGVGVAAVAVAGIVAAKVIRDRRRKDIVGRLKDVVSFDDLKGELQNVREELAHRRAGKPTDNEPLWAKAAIKAAVAGATVASTYAARQMVSKYDAGDPKDIRPGEAAGRAAKAV